MEEIRMTQVLENVKNAWENFKGEKWKAESCFVASVASAKKDSSPSKTFTLFKMKSRTSISACV
jgi:hypothetical protein